MEKKKRRENILRRQVTRVTVRKLIPVTALRVGSSQKAQLSLTNPREKLLHIRRENKLQTS